MNDVASSGVALEAVGSNRWLLSGRLDFSTVPDAWTRLLPLVSVPGPMVLSLKGVSHANSASLAFLLQGLEQAQQTGCALQYVDLPEELIALAEMSNCGELLLNGH